MTKIYDFTVNVYNHCDSNNNQDHTIKYLNRENDSNYDYDIFDLLYDVNDHYYRNNNDGDHTGNKDFREDDAVPFTVQDTTQQSSKEEQSTVQCSNNQNMFPSNRNCS